jgi:phage terminase Nu1 subunit (DNA packaging protein)
VRQVDLSSTGTQSALGELVGVTQQAISAMNLPGGTLGDMLLAYCHRLREVAAGRQGMEGGGLDLIQERAALAREQRIGHEIKNEVARKTYAPISMLAETLALASQAVVERFDQLPGILKKTCPDMSDTARDQVMKSIAAARNEWVKGTRELMVAQLAGDDDAADDTSDYDDL